MTFDEQLAEAREREQLIRNAAFLDLTEVVCGVEVQPLTLRHCCTLEALGNPFMVGGFPAWDDVVRLLWIVSPSYSRSKLALALFARKLRKVKFADAVEQVGRYVSEAFQDRQGTPKQTGAHVSYYSNTAGIVSAIANQFHWSEQAILDLPMKRALQYMKTIGVLCGSNTPLFNPSDSVINQRLLELNRTQTQ